MNYYYFNNNGAAFGASVFAERLTVAKLYTTLRAPPRQAALFKRTQIEFCTQCTHTLTRRDNYNNLNRVIKLNITYFGFCAAVRMQICAVSSFFQPLMRGVVCAAGLFHFIYSTTK